MNDTVCGEGCTPCDNVDTPTELVLPLKATTNVWVRQKQCCDFFAWTVAKRKWSQPLSGYAFCFLHIYLSVNNHTRQREQFQTTFFGSHTIRWNKLKLLKVSLQFSAYESTFQFTTNPCSIFIPQTTIAAHRRVDMHIKRSPADIITPLIKLCSSRCRMFCSSVRLGLSIQNILRLE